MNLWEEKIESINLYPKVIKDFKEMSLNTVFDVLEFIPNRYINYKICDINAFYTDKISIKGEVCSIPICRNFKKNLGSMSFNIIVDNEIIKVNIFNRNFYKDKLTIGKEVFVYGKYDYFKKIMTCENLFFNLDESITTIYPLSYSSKAMKFAIGSILHKYKNEIIEILPKSIIDKYKFISNYNMYKNLHIPENMDDVNSAIRRYKYQELFLFELKLSIRKLTAKKEYKEPKKYDILKVKEFISTIPFELTDDQKNAVNDIFRDFKEDYSANRLIEGDVGSGKTIVSAIGIYGAYTANYQSALMAPTEILANQHYNNLCNLFKDAIKIELLTSSVKGKKRAEILEKIKNGEVNLVVGTHSIIQEDIIYNNLGLVITDEQHRFGVKQREALRLKGNNPDVLFLTATPIPRTLALSLFADLDLSMIKTKINNRKIIKTKVVNYNNIKIADDVINQELKNGHQVYMIAPLVNESEVMDFKNVHELYEEIRVKYSNYNVGILHGEMKSKEKDEAMDKFKNHEYDILVSTTVIEVGVDVKNATVIAIYDASRFGLSQLHQLRGRVGRNDLSCYCFLISDYENERLKVIENVYDGFVLAEEDLKLRGPGDFFGTKQSGIPSFKLADLKTDLRILEDAKVDADIIAKEIDNYQQLKCFVFQNNLVE